MATAPQGGDTGGTLKLTLYVAGQTPKSVAAIRNLEAICSEHLGPDRYVIDVIDLRQQLSVDRHSNFDRRHLIPHKV